jgi:hypothetical protein
MKSLAEEEGKLAPDASRQGDALEGRSPIHAATEKPAEHDEA